MSLRARLAVLYTSIVGGILLLFGLAVYGTVSFSLTAQLDNALRAGAAAAAQQILPNIFYQAGELHERQPQSIDIATGVFVQVWGRSGRLVTSSANFALNRPMDPAGLQSGQPVFRETHLSTDMGSAHLRVYTVPLMVGDRQVGALQVGISLSVVDATQQTLLFVLVIGAAVSMGVAGLAGWYSTRQALAPLDDVTRVALQITRADDLSRRIPYQGPPDDEVGQLIHAFNRTLSRLENLFNSQRRFLADVGHELRTPLTVIKGNVDLMRRMGSMDVESMDSIENEVERLTRMVGDVLLLAQAESGKLPLERNPVELDSLLLDAMQQMRVLATDKLRLRLGEIDQVMVCGDRDRLKQVLVNLISNAIKYTPEGGSVTVSLGKEGDRAWITVSDTGPGIPPEDLPHIFERFYRGEKSRTRSRDGKGFGLGLSIAYWIVRNHAGTIQVESNSEGTTFKIQLPLAQGDCQETVEEIPEENFTP
jgi:two-component system OmpR family sensor kinase